jgi:hypothetical protein
MKVELMKLYSTLLFLSFSFFPALVSSQQNHEARGDEPARLEINARTDRDSYKVLSCGRHGVLVFFKSVEIADDKRIKWYFSLYDQNLALIWTKSLPVLTDLDYKFTKTIQDTLALVFVNTGKQKNEDQALEIIRIPLLNGLFIPNLTKVPANTEPVFIAFAGRFAYLALNHKNGPAAIEIIDLITNHTKGFFTGREFPTSVRWFAADSISGMIKMILTKAVNKKENEHWFEVFDTTGNVKTSIQVSTINADRDFTGFKAVVTPTGDDLVIGSYRLASSGTNEKNKGVEESSGIFTSLIVPGNQKNLNFYNFLELKSANSLLSMKNLMDLKKKALKKNKNIGEYSADFRVLFHELFTQNGSYILISEIYGSQYHSENFTDFDFYGRPFSNSYAVFDGYRFTNAVITAFNAEGQLLWDNALEIRDVISYDLSPKVCAIPQGDRILIAYNSSGKIGSKIIRREETPGKLEFSPVELKYPDDKLLSETRNGMVPWYDNYFLCYGFQDIKNVALEENNRRLVFYLTKVKFEE